MLIAQSYIKQNFPQWDHYAAFDEQAADTQAALDNQIQNAQYELSQYVTVTAQTMTDALKLHLFNIVRYNLFMLQHADTEFESDPQIVDEYEQTIKMLTSLREGERPAQPGAPGEAQGKAKISAKNRRFDQWFTDTNNHIVHSDDKGTP